MVSKENDPRNDPKYQAMKRNNQLNNSDRAKLKRLHESGSDKEQKEILDGLVEDHGKTKAGKILTDYQISVGAKKPGLIRRLMGG